MTETDRRRQASQGPISPNARVIARENRSRLTAAIVRLDK